MLASRCGQERQSALQPEFVDARREGGASRLNEPLEVARRDILPPRDSGNRQVRILETLRNMVEGNIEAGSGNGAQFLITRPGIKREPQRDQIVYMADCGFPQRRRMQCKFFRQQS